MRIFSLDEGYKCLRSLDLNKYFAQHQQDNEESNENQEEPGLAVIGLCYDCRCKNEATPIDYNHYHATRYSKTTKNCVRN